MKRWSSQIRKSVNNCGFGGCAFIEIKDLKNAQNGIRKFVRRNK